MRNHHKTDLSFVFKIPSFSSLSRLIQQTTTLTILIFSGFDIFCESSPEEMPVPIFWEK